MVAIIVRGSQSWSSDGWTLARHPHTHTYIYINTCKTVHRYAVSVMVLLLLHMVIVLFILCCVHGQSSMFIVFVGQTSPPCPSVSLCLCSPVHPPPQWGVEQFDGRGDKGVFQSFSLAQFRHYFSFQQCCISPCQKEKSYKNEDKSAKTVSVSSLESHLVTNSRPPLLLWWWYNQGGKLAPVTSQMLRKYESCWSISETNSDVLS